jgi:hypothetical protein
MSVERAPFNRQAAVRRRRGTAPPFGQEIGTPQNLPARKIPRPNPISLPVPPPTTPTVTATPLQRDGCGLLQGAAGGARRLRRRAQEGVPEAGHEVAPGQEPQQQEGCRGQVQADLRGVRGLRACPCDRPLSFPRRHCASDLRWCS